jgi:oligopeptide/dipeptide ABC transporter ATP-binding protein
MALLDVRQLTVHLEIDGELRAVVRDLSFSIEAGAALGLVGESGAGKSMTARALARLLPPGAITSGTASVAGQDMLALRRAALRDARSRIAFVFQDPRAHINPVRRIGDFMTEQMRSAKLDRATATRRAVEQLRAVGIEDGERRLGQFPHELSGGLLQRVMIATVLLAEPDVILADEPTTALDVTTQSEVMAILDELRRERGVAMLFITHDLDLAAAVCDHTAVMYAGQIVELQPSASLHLEPLHPYTAGLTAARPSLVQTARRLPVIPGRAISAWEVQSGCAFAHRCQHCQPRCMAAVPALEQLGAGEVRCVRARELHHAPEVTRA